MLADRYQHLSGHVTALLGPWGLVLDMNTSSTLLNEQLGQLHDRRQTTMSSIGICDNGSEVVNVGEFAALGFRFGGDALFPLLSVVEKLRHEEMSDLVWDGGLA